MIYTGLLSVLLAEYAANRKCSAVLLCSADSIYPRVGIPCVSFYPRDADAGTSYGPVSVCLCL